MFLTLDNQKQFLKKYLIKNFPSKYKICCKLLLSQHISATVDPDQNKEYQSSGLHPDHHWLCRDQVSTSKK